MQLKKLFFGMTLFFGVSVYAQDLEKSLEEQLDEFNAKNNPILDVATMLCTDSFGAVELARCYGIENSQCVGVVSEILARCESNPNGVVFRDGVDYGAIRSLDGVARCMAVLMLNQGLDNGFVGVSNCQ